MTRMNRVTWELLFIVTICAVVTGISFVQGHSRAWLLLILTVCLGLLGILAQLGHSRQVRTLKGKRGRRKKQIPA